MTRAVEFEGIEGGVVVGDDGSECAADALRYAAEEAQRRGTGLHVIRAWMIATAPRPKDWTYGGGVPSIEELQAATEAATRERVAALLPDSGLSVTVHAPHAQAAEALVAASKLADVVVVGARGRGGFAALRLGSTADQVAHHAASPVIVVKPRA